MRTQIAVAAVILLVITGLYGIYDLFYGTETLETEELENGATIVTVADRQGISPARERTEIRYTWNDASYSSFFVDWLRPALDTIQRETPQPATIAAWWDYGHSIRGYTGRNVIAYTPSEWAYEHTVADDTWNTDDQGTFTPHNTLHDLATIFVADPANATRVMADYNASHLLLARTDIGKYAAIQQVYNKDQHWFGGLRRISCTMQNAHCRTEQRQNQTYFTYTAADSQFHVPITQQNDTYTVTGTATRQQHGQTRRVPPCSDAVGESNTAGCVAIDPFHGASQLVYVPEAAINTMFARLLFAPDTLDDWHQVHADESAQLWEHQP